MEERGEIEIIKIARRLRGAQYGRIYRDVKAASIFPYNSRRATEFFDGVRARERAL